jgi:hypothetical protein
MNWTAVTGPTFTRLAWVFKSDENHLAQSRLHPLPTGSDTLEIDRLKANCSASGGDAVSIYLAA